MTRWVAVSASEVLIRPLSSCARSGCTIFWSRWYAAFTWRASTTAPGCSPRIDEATRTMPSLTNPFTFIVKWTSGGIITPLMRRTSAARAASCSPRADEAAAAADAAAAAGAPAARGAGVSAGAAAGAAAAGAAASSATSSLFSTQPS